MNSSKTIVGQAVHVKGAALHEVSNVLWCTNSYMRPGWTGRACGGHAADKLSIACSARRVGPAISSDLHSTEKSTR